MGDRDIVEFLVDFDHYGNTATERFSMRMSAVTEIKKLRENVKRLRRSAKAPRSGDAAVKSAGTGQRVRRCHRGASRSTHLLQRTPHRFPFSLGRELVNP
jgi:hypothetical protein